MMKEIAKLHRLALPNTWSSKRGEKFVSFLYQIVGRVGYVRKVERGGEIVGVISGVGRWILTLVVTPVWQRRGIGRELMENLPGRRYVYTDEESVEFYRKIGFKHIIRLGKVIFLWRR